MVRSFVILFFLFPLFAHAEPKARATLLSEVKSLKPGQSAWLGLHLSMEKGWHVYWKNPGETGKPPQVEWNKSSALEIQSIQWPAPERIIVGDLVNYGYEGDVLLPFQVKVTEGFRNKSVHITGHASWLVCQEECIPESQAVEISLPVSETIPALDGGNAKAFDQAKSAIPRELPRGSVQVGYDEGGYTFRIPEEVFSGTSVSTLRFFPDEQDWISSMAPQRLAHEGSEYVLRIQAEENFPVPNQISGILAARHSNEEAIGVSFNETVSEESRPGGIFLWLFSAFLGGLILNLMPCVFPVLSIKILAVAHARDNPKELKRHAYFYALGILVSFWLVAGVLLGLQALGHEIGWGFQLQVPAFVSLLAVLFFIMALNLLSLFEFSGSWTGVGQQLASREGAFGSFFTGALAVVVATPCSAPFMGTAVGVALLKPGLATFLIFSFLGLGLAAPYLAIPFFPALIGFLPKPGVWMERLRKLLAIPLLATVIWLLWILCSEAPGMWVIGTIGIFFALLIYVLWKSETLPSKGQVLLLGAFFILAIGAGVSTRMPSMIPMQKWQLDWQKFSESAVEAARRENIPVLVDFTADWCITCKVNEHLVLNSAGFQKLVKENGIKLFRADWTNEDPEITRVLKKFQRVGVPLYVVYPMGGQPVVLPQVLTLEAIKSVLIR